MTTVRNGATNLNSLPEPPTNTAIADQYKSQEGPSDPSRQKAWFSAGGIEPFVLGTHRPYAELVLCAHSVGAARVGTIASWQLYNSREVQCGIFRVVG
jgi:hypothetical protein